MVKFTLTSKLLIFFLCRRFSFVPFLPLFATRYLVPILVILLNATYIWPELKDFWQCRSKLITPSSKLRPCTLWTVHVHDNTSENWVLLTHDYDLLFKNQTTLHFFWLVFHAVNKPSNQTALSLILHLDH